MKDVPGISGKGVLSLFTALVAITFSTPTQAEVVSGQVLVSGVQGAVTYSVTGKDWQPVREKMTLGSGATIKTAQDATADLVLQYNGSVLRMLPNSTLSFDKLSKESAGEEVITETSLNLTEGALIGSQRKLASPSHLDIKIPGGVATIVGTEYYVRADGAVSVISGSVKVIYNLPNNGGSVQVDVPAGYSFDPATGQVVVTTSDYLQHIIAHIDTVKNNAQVFKAGGATVVVKPEKGTVSTTKGHGNNGVGNGIDPQPPGNPPINDGPGTGPGNPGNKGHGHS
jgi:hypothetical protein